MNKTRQALGLALSVYESFLKEVVESCVLDDRVGALPQKAAQRIRQGRRVDTRLVRLATISGKGGCGYEACRNVSLLDHALSVVRGALILAALDSVAADPGSDLERLEKVLRAVAAIAFLHDVDKDLELARNTPLDPEAVWERWRRYGLDRFTAEWRLRADQVVALIERVEATQAHRSQAAEPPPRLLTRFIDYIGLADKLDGKWCCQDAAAVIEHLRRTPVLRHNLLRDWSVVSWYAPHYPFLLDEYLRWLSAGCQQVTGVPPLLELHHDGHLLALIPQKQAEDIKAWAMRAFIDWLRRRLFRWRLNISNRNVPEILDGRPDHAGLQDYFRETIDEKSLRRLFVVQVGLKARLTPELDALLAPLDLAPRWPSKATGQTLPLYPNPGRLSDTARDHLGRAAHLATLLKHKETPGLPSSEAREATLAEILGEAPDWIGGVADRVSRQTLLSLWATAVSRERPAIEAAIWGEGGCLNAWLQALHTSLSDPGADLLAAVERRFQQGLQRQAIQLAESGKQCLFTALPVDPRTTGRVRDNDNLYEVKASAFSGRDGRLESLDTDRAETYVEPVSYVEYRLRRLVHEGLSGRRQGLPVSLSAPATTGLFAALVLRQEQDYAHLSVYDLARQDVNKGTVYEGMEIHHRRYRIARYEVWPPRLADQVDLLRLLLQACLRLGRPLHLFRGLPTPQKAFFYADALPARLADLLGGSALRLEQIPAALERLRHAQVLLTTPGLGLETFNRYACPATRLGAVALAACRLRDAASDGNAPDDRSFQQEFLQLTEDDTMNDDSNALVRLGRLATGIQCRPCGLASSRKEMMCFNLALDAAIAAWHLGMRDREALIYAVAGELETNLVRQEQAAHRRHRQGCSLRQGCLAWAEDFVDQVWFGPLHGKPPAQRSRRILGAIYRMAFLTAPQDEARATESTV